MKIRFTSVTTENVGGILKGVSASYEVRDSDGFGNVGIDSGGLAPEESLQPTYASVAAVEALTQTQIYNDFYDNTVIDSSGITVGQAWLQDLQETLDIQVKVAQVQSNNPFESADNIADQTPINI